MNPKDKAEELVDNFSIAVGAFNKTSYRYEYEKAKLCALIAADEIYKAVKIAQANIEEYRDYWLQVKSEIEKL